MLPAGKSQRGVQNGQTNTVLAIEGNRCVGIIAGSKNEISGMVAVSTVAKPALQHQRHFIAAMGMLWNAATRRDSQQCKLVLHVAR